MDYQPSGVFGFLLPWRIVKPARVHATVYNGYRYTIEYKHKATVQEWDKFGSAGRYLFDEDQDQPGYGLDYPHGYYVGDTVLAARRLAELKLVCPEVESVSEWDFDIPSISSIFWQGRSPRFESAIVSCQLEWNESILTPNKPSYILLLGAGGFVHSIVEIHIRVPKNPERDHITAMWILDCDGVREEYPTWAEAYKAALKAAEGSSD